MVLARQLYGERWKGKTAYALGVRRDTLDKIVRGKLALAPGLLLKLQLHYEEVSHADRANASVLQLPTSTAEPARRV